MTTTYDSTTGVDFNITIGLGNDKEVTVYAKDLDKVGENGLHFKLPEGTTVEVGLFDFIVWLNARLDDIGAPKIPSQAGDAWPDPIQNIFNGILNAEVKVTRLELDQDKKDAEGNSPPLKLQLAVTGTAVDSADHTLPKPIGIIPNPSDSSKSLLSVVGGGIGISRTYEAKTS